MFLYLNYHPINDFVINLENVWKFIGFSNKANAKRLLKHHFIENKDYKTALLRTEKRKNEGDKTVIRTDDGKFSNETIMMNRKKVHIGTFDTELEACKAYNDTVSKLNDNGCNYKINKF